MPEEKPAENSAEKPAEQPAEKPAQRTAQKPAGKTARKAVEKPARKRSYRKDPTVIDAVEIAEEAVKTVARPDRVGPHLGAKMVDDRVAVHQFKSLDEGYPGWVWEATVARAPRSRKVTIDEVYLAPGADALLAPDWVPWADRLEPSDISRTDLLPYDAHDPRLQAGFEQVDEDGADVRPDEHMGLGRPRVLSKQGLDEAATRWYDSPRGPVPGLKPNETCSTCGFLMKLPGSMGTLFGVCANEWAQDDGTVVSLDHGCGAHSETDQPKREPVWPAIPSRVDDYEVEYFSVEATED